MDMLWGCGGGRARTAAAPLLREEPGVEAAHEVPPPAREVQDQLALPEVPVRLRARPSFGGMVESNPFGSV